MNSYRSDDRLAKAYAVIKLLQDELAATNREVMLLTLDLEQRVAKRTAELSQTNQELMKEITERKRAEEEISKLNRVLEHRAELLQAANQELESFSYSVSHDLRAPLRHIGGFAVMLQEDAELNEAGQAHLDKILQAAGKMGTLIDGLLRFSRLLYADLNLTSVSLDVLVESVIHDFEADTHGRNIVWRRGPLPTVRADGTLLRQVFVNLISNAIKYTRPRDPAEIEIGILRRDTQEVVIFVRDNGAGFEPQYAEKLFGVFQRLHHEREFEGIGIGLANVRRIVVRHGGKIWAESKPGEGATFYFSLPLK